MAQKRKVGRPRAGADKRDKRITVVLTTAEYDTLVEQAQAIGVPLFLLSRWLLTGHPIPRPPLAKK